MFFSISNILVSAITGIFTQFNRWVSALPDFFSFYFTIVFLILLFRFVILPSMGGSSGSDSVKKSKKNNNIS